MLAWVVMSTITLLDVKRPTSNTHKKVDPVGLGIRTTDIFVLILKHEGKLHVMYANAWSFSS